MRYHRVRGGPHFPMLPSARDLNPAERLIVQRRRLGLSKADMARELGVSLYRYYGWERGDSVEPPPGAKIGALEPHEAVHVARLRAGLRLSDLAEQVERSAWWVSRMEVGEVDPTLLVEFWRSRPETASAPGA